MLKRALYILAFVFLFIVKFIPISLILIVLSIGQLDDEKPRLAFISELTY